MPQPRFDLLHRYGSVARLCAACRASPGVRYEIVAELAAIASLEQSGRSVEARDYGQALRRAMTMAEPEWDATDPASYPTSKTAGPVKVGSYTIEEDAAGNLNVVAADGTTIPLVRKE